MARIPGAPPVPLPQLVRTQDRLTFLYLEHCLVHRDANAIIARDAKGTVHIPAATLGVLLLGPGTSVSQQAMVLLAESGSTAVWVSEQGVRYYAHGRSLARSSRLLEAQASLVSSVRSRLRVAREMYAIRFPRRTPADSPCSSFVVGKAHGSVASIASMPSAQGWSGPGVITTLLISPVAHRSIRRSPPLIRACTALSMQVILALGCSPGLGFVHTGHVRSFVYDIADLYKAEVTIPIAFDIAVRDVADIGAETRRAVRDAMRGGAFLETCVGDIQTLLRDGDNQVRVRT